MSEGMIDPHTLNECIRVVWESRRDVTMIGENTRPIYQMVKLDQTGQAREYFLSVLVNEIERDMKAAVVPSLNYLSDAIAVATNSPPSELTERLLAVSIHIGDLVITAKLTEVLKRPLTEDEVWKSLDRWLRVKGGPRSDGYVGQERVRGEDLDVRDGQAFMKRYLENFALHRERVRSMVSSCYRGFENDI